MIQYFLFALMLQTADTNQLLQQARQQLSSGKKSISDLLQDVQYMSLHQETSFRDIIRSNAKAERIAIASSKEPGTPVLIKGKLVAKRSVNNLLIYVYHTDNKGWYSASGPHVEMMEGDRRHARLFGYLRADKNGAFEFTSIHPQGYPNSNLPQHIHLEVYDETGKTLLITELLFDDDPRLNTDAKTRAVHDGYFIAKNEGSESRQQYSYAIKF